MILGDRIFFELDQGRFCCITGALSGGKTRLAFEFALRYWRMGYRVRSNIPHTLKDYPEHSKPAEWDGTLYKTFCVVDEPGEFIREARVASPILRSAGKADYYMVFSGKRLPHKILQDVIIEPRFDFYQNYGIPMVLWKVTINASTKYNFPVWQWMPQGVHGIYSTLTSAGSPDFFGAMADTTIKRLAGMEGQDAGVMVAAGYDGLADDLASEAFKTRS